MINNKHVLYLSKFDHSPQQVLSKNEKKKYSLKLNNYNKEEYAKKIN